MKKLLHIWLFIFAMVLLYTSCDSMPHYDRRLVAADSLLNRNDIPRDSALKVLSLVSFQELTKESDQAYYSLLLTQAQFRNYIRFNNDSVINLAVRYYQKHDNERDKLTRSYLFKGSVFQDLNIPDSAMFYYKMAELYADENDYFNRGYAQLRMGSLYRIFNAYDGRDIEKYEQATENFRLSKNNHFLIVSLRDLGALYRYRKVDKAEETLNEAILLAGSEPNEIANFRLCVSLLAYLYFMQGNNDKAYHQLQRIKPSNFYGLDESIYTTFACVYANKGEVDSASRFIDLAEQQYCKDSSYYHSSYYLVPKSYIAKAQGNMLEYYKLSHENDSLDFNEIRKQDIIKIMYSELECDQLFQKKQDRASSFRYYIMAGIILSMMLLALWFYRKSHRYDRLVLELKDQSQNQMLYLTDMQHSINELQINDERLKGFISSHMDMMREIIEACYHEPNNRIAENMKRIVKFQDNNKDNWIKLFDYIDLEHNNIMTRTRQNYPELMIASCCCWP